jgi:hypothetical protein
MEQLLIYNNKKGMAKISITRFEISCFDTPFKGRPEKEVGREGSIWSFLGIEEIKCKEAKLIHGD